MASLTRNTAFAFLMALEEDLIQALTELGPAATPLTEGETAQATSRRAADLGGDAAPGIWTDLLYYLDLGQKLDVVRRAEHDLARQLAIDVADLRNLDSLLRPLVTIRNRVCHARPMDEDDLPRVIDVARGAIDGRLPFRRLAEQFAQLGSNEFPFLLHIPDFWRSTEKTKHNLPVSDFEDTGYIGRQKDRASLIGLLMGSHPVVTVTGEGGIGKTALAVRCLYDIVDNDDNPYDAIAFASLKNNRLTPGGIEALINAMGNEIDVLQPVLTMFDPRDEPLDRDELFDRVVEILRLFRVLLVIDNLESIDSDALRPLLIRIPAGSKVLLTSRIGLGEIEIRYSLEPLLQQDAVRLFRKLTRLLNVEDLAKRPDDQLAEICSRLFFSPLIIRWFVQGYAEGRSLPELLNRPRSFDSVLEFCFENVYSRLSPAHLHLLQTMVLAPAALSEAASCQVV